MWSYLWDNIVYMQYIDNFLNRITMYKLVLYGLQILALISIILGFAGVVSYSGISLLYSALVITIVCYTSNYLLARIFKVQENVESSSITAFILFFVLGPISSLSDIIIFVIVGVLAMASKYFLAIGKKHVFNPVAISIFIVGVFGSGVAYWWVGSSVLLIPTAILGFLILRKVKRFQMFFSFIASAVVSLSIVALFNNLNIFESLSANFLSGPLIFFGAIMFTEPFTTPPKRNLQIIYGIVVGIFIGLDFSIGPIHTTPELALILGNIFSFIVSPKDKLVLKLISKSSINVTQDVDEFVFEPNKRLNFKAGQYLEWTLGHKKVDSRGNRRYFTISSSPTEKEIKLSVKFYDKVSSFKQSLGELPLGSTITAGSLSGEFTLPEDKNKRLVFIAGGIGITPFRSMAKYLIDNNEKRDIVLFSSNKTKNDIVYTEIFNEAERVIGMKTIYVVNSNDGELSSNMRLGMVDENMIKKDVQDYKDRMYYISGPHGMVDAFEKTLKNMGVPNRNIKIDFFPGFV